MEISSTLLIAHSLLTSHSLSDYSALLYSTHLPLLYKYGHIVYEYIVYIVYNTVSLL